MLKNMWYAICESKEITNKPKSLKRLNHNFVLYRTSDNQIACFDDLCTHRGASLGQGQIIDGCIQCPFHGFTFDADGNCVKIPANGKDARVPKRFNLNCYPTYELDNFIFIYYGSGEPEPKQPYYFNELLDGFSYGHKKHLWNTHYSRAIENQLDIVHVPFVHEKTIGRGNKTLVNGPVVKWDELMMRFYVMNEVDNGQKPLKSSEMNQLITEESYHLQFIMPNLWQNKISDDVRITIAFVPVDDDHTLIYLRFYQKFMRVPVLKSIVNRLAMIFNNKVLAEDYHIIKKQLPRVSFTAVNEQLIPGDLPIGEYRRRFRELSADIQKEDE